MGTGQLQERSKVMVGETGTAGVHQQGGRSLPLRDVLEGPIAPDRYPSRSGHPPGNRVRAIKVVQSTGRRSLDLLTATPSRPDRGPWIPRPGPARK
jgi:hypothetical protein